MLKIFDQVLESTAREVHKIDWTSKEIYSNYLFQTHCFVKHSTRLLALAAGRMEFDLQELHLRFLAHMGEEKSHEKLLELDLKELGFDLGGFQELNVTRAFYESQYYKIEHVDPTALLGYILFLEGAAVRLGPIAFRHAAEVHGSATTRFLKLHTSEDPDHVQKAFKTLEHLRTDQLVHIQENLQQSGELYNLILRGLDPHVQKSIRQAS